MRDASVIDKNFGWTIATLCPSTPPPLGYRLEVLVVPSLDLNTNYLYTFLHLRLLQMMLYPVHSHLRRRPT